MTLRSPLWSAIAMLLVALVSWVGDARAAGDLRIEFDGKPATFEAPPMEQSGVVCVPMKGIFQRLGAVVNYDPLTRTVKALRGKTLVLITLGKDTATVNLKPHRLQVPAFLHQGAVMVPLRFVSEVMGARVAYDEKTHVVSIRSGKEPVVTLPTVRIPPETSTPIPPPSEAPSTAPDVAITEFRHDASAPLHPGDTLTVTMVGTGKGQASFSIPGVVDKSTLSETSSGAYTAQYKIPGGVSVKGAPVYGVLQVGAQRAPLATAPNPITIQPLVPHIEKPAPAPGSTVNEKTPRIAGFFETVGGVLDLPSVRISVNGADVTKQAYITREFFTYTPPQPLSGQVKVEVAGRVSPPGSSVPAEWTDHWTFEIQGGLSKIQSATHGPTSIYKPGDVVEVTMIGTAGGKARFDIGTWKTGVEMREASSGTYIGSYRVQPSDRVQSASIVVHLRVGADDVAAQAPIPVTLGIGVAGDNAMPLTVTAPEAGAGIGKSFVVRGQTAPKARVKVEVMGHVPVVDRLVRVAWGEASADAQGTYSVNVQLPVMVPGAKLTLVVTSSDASGKSAGPVQVPVIGK